MTQQSVIFLHIPKSAGSTLVHVVRRQYNPCSIFSLNDGNNPQERMKQFKQLPEYEREATQVLMGHMYFGAHEFLPQPSTYITMLRDPIERIISFYYYVLRHPDHNHYNLITSKNLSLKDYVKNGIKQLDNGQTRLLSGIDALDVEFGNCSEQMLERAKLNLQKYFAVVGITEKFDESLLLMKSKLSWEKSILYKKANVTKNRPKKLDFPEADLREIEKQNEFDIELYRYAQELFTHQLEESYIEKNLRQFIFLNNNYQTYTKTIGKLKSIVKSLR